MFDVALKESDLRGKANGWRPCCSSLSFSTQFFCASKVSQTFLWAVLPFWLGPLCVKIVVDAQHRTLGVNLSKNLVYIQQSWLHISWSTHYDQQNTIHTSNKSSLILTSSVVLRRGGLFILKEEGIWWFYMISSS